METGYYWVRYTDVLSWEVAEYDNASGIWYWMGDGEDDTVPGVIGPRILPPHDLDAITEFEYPATVNAP